jgi:acyl carrier protein
MTKDDSPEATSVEFLKSWLIDWISREMRIDHSMIDPSRAFLSYGMDSMKAMTMVGDIEALLSLRLSPTLAWDYPDIDTLSAHLVGQMSAAAAPVPAAPSPASSTAELERLLARVDTLDPQDVEKLLDRYATRV